MKDMVLVPIKFLLFLLAALTIGTGTQVLIDFSRLPQDLQQAGMSTISLLIASSFFLWIIPAVCATWLLVSFSILRRGKMKTVRQVVLMAMVGGSLFAILYWLPSLEKADARSATLDFQVPQGSILSNEQAFFIVHEGPDATESKLLFHAIGEDGVFKEINGVRKDLDGQALLVPDEALAFPMGEVRGGRQRLFEDIGFIKPLRELLLSGLKSYRSFAANDWLRSLVLAAASALLLGSFWLFVRLTQWPLFNSFLTVVMLLGASLLPALLAGQSFRELFGFIPPDIMPWLLPGIYASCALVLSGLILLLPSRKDWQPGVNL